jgi:hypothetical protein
MEIKSTAHPLLFSVRQDQEKEGRARQQLFGGSCHTATDDYSTGYKMDIKQESNFAKGKDGEIFVSGILSKNGIENTLMPTGHPFDILCGNGKRIDVKYSPTECRLNRFLRSPQYRFHVRKNARDKTDFYICVTAEKSIFIIPSRDVPSQMDHIIFCYPMLTRKKRGKWLKYLNAFDLLKQEQITTLAATQKRIDEMSKKVFDAWVINTRSAEGHGLIGRFWHFDGAPEIPVQVLGCRCAMFETRKAARAALPKVKRAFPQATVERVTVRIDSFQNQLAATRERM